MIDIPDGWVQVTDGLVSVGDRIWAALNGRWLDVDEQMINDLAFIDAMAVEECHCVIRPKT